MNVPDCLTYYVRDGQKPFEALTDLDPARADEILKHDTQWRGDGTYLGHRVYAILGESPTGPHDLENEYAWKIRIYLADFSRGDVCFTCPDSLYEVPLDDLGRLYLKRNARPTISTIEELALVIGSYRVYEIHNHYVEAQIWNDRPLQPCADERHWMKCCRR